MAYRLSDVVGIMDMDGFMVNKIFYCKELVVLKIGDVVARSFFFDLGLRWSDLTQKDRRTCKYVESFVHKLPFGVRRGSEALGISTLERIVADFYRENKQNADSRIAYKGAQKWRLRRLDSGRRTL